MQEIVQFRISDKALNDFLRLNSNSYDCVANALELLGVLQKGEAAIARILTPQGGMKGWQITKIFNTHIKLRQGRGYQNEIITTGSPDEFLEALKSQLKPGHVSFCVTKRRTMDPVTKKISESGHAFMVGRHTDGNIVILDPQTFRNGYTVNIRGQAAEKFFADSYQWGIMFKVPSQETRKRTRGAADPNVLVRLRKLRGGPVVKKARK